MQEKLHHSVARVLRYEVLLRDLASSSLWLARKVLAPIELERVCDAFRVWLW